MRWATRVEYPLFAIGDLHGRRDRLERLLARLGARPEWPDAALVFLGDFPDRGPDVRGALDLVLDLAGDRRAPVTAVMGNHDLALVRAARLDGGPHSDYWAGRYRSHYDCDQTFLAYLGRRPRKLDTDTWLADLEALRAAMPTAHAEALAGLPWLVEAPGHLFLHAGLSDELEQSAEEQIEALRGRRWDGAVTPRADTETARLWQPHYPVWLGADRRLCERPLPVPGRVQVSGHVKVPGPEHDGVSIRIDTAGGLDLPLTACLLRSADADPEFIAGG